MLSRDKLLLAFEGRTGQVVSGSALARRLGVSRTSVWKHVRALQSQGMPIESDSRNGYRFQGPTDFSLLWPRLPAGLPAWVTPHYELSTATTQNLAKEGAQTGKTEGHLWIAETQTAGRGRLDRVWESSFGGLWFSLLLKPSLPPAEVPPVTLVAAMTLAEAVSDISGVQARLKWPNDVMVEFKGRWLKLAGLLTEMTGDMDRTHWVVLGVGVNVHNQLPPSLRSRAVSLTQAAGKAISRGALLKAFLTRFHLQYLRLQKEGFQPFQAAYWKLYARPGAPVCVQTSRGELTGTACGVDGQGALMVKSRRKTYHLFEGEIV